MEVLRWGYRIPFVSVPPLSQVPIPLPSYSSTSIKGRALRGEIDALIAKGTVELAPLSPGYYSRLFVVQKASSAWRPVMDLSALNKFVKQTKFRMESNQSILRAVQRFDWMISFDLKDAYLQVPIYPDSRKFLRFMVGDTVYQFRALCFGLSTSPQVFTRVMTPVSVMLHNHGIRMLRYLDDWLILARSHQEAIQARDEILLLCSQLGIVMNLEKSCLSPSQTATYLGMVLVSPSLRAFPTEKRVDAVLKQIEEFLSFKKQSVVTWRCLLGRLSSLCHLVPAGRLRMRSLQLQLRQHWDFVDEDVLVPWNSQIRSDLHWWSDARHLLSGVSLLIPQPDLLFWSDASDQGWGAMC